VVTEQLFLFPPLSPFSEPFPSAASSTFSIIRVILVFRPA
jgi:hypothetical protein